MGTYANFYNSDNGDRIYDAEAFAEWLKPFFKTGVFNNELQVVASSGMNVVVKSGNAYIEGKLKKFDNETVLTLEPASSTVDRIDAIVVRRNDTERDFTIQVIKGSINAPQPVREGGIYDIVLAHISVPKATTQITTSLITDTRMNSNICGWVVSNVEEVDFNQITAQFSDYLARFEEDNLQEFTDWFNLIKDQLTTDQAGALWTAIEHVQDMELITSGSCNDLGVNGQTLNYRVTGKDVANKPYAGGSFIITAYNYDAINKFQIAQNIYNRSMWKRFYYEGAWTEWEVLHSLSDGTVVSNGSDYGVVGPWQDGNPSSEDRLYRFVTIVGDNREIAIANSTSQIVGTSNLVENVGFLGNYTNGAESDTSKVIVSILGCSYVKTNDNTIVANDRVMSDDLGYAIKSTNNLGYRVLKVVESGLLEIVVSPNTDMVQRIRTDVMELQESALHIDLLWTNASPTSEFASQTISLDLSQYKFIYITYKRKNDNDFKIPLLCKKNHIYHTIDYYGGYSARDITSLDDNGITFSSGSLGSYINDLFLAPYQIYGVK